MTIDRAFIRKIGPYLIIGIAAVAFFFPVILYGRTFYAFDTLFDAYPWRVYSENISIHNPRITDPINVFYPSRLLDQSEEDGFGYWNSRILSGKVRRQNVNPLWMLLLPVLPVSVAHDFLLFFHLFLAGILSLLYLKKIGLRGRAALIGALSWMFNGYVMVWFEFENIIMMAVTLPGILYFLECFKEKQRLLSFLLLIALTSYAVSIGSTNILIFEVLFIVIYVIVFFTHRCIKSGGVRSLTKSLLLLIVVCIISAFINFTQIINNISLFDKGQRNTYTFSQLFEYAGQIPSRYLTTLIYPDFYGNPVREHNFAIRDQQAYNNYNEMCLYAGILPLMLALAGANLYRSRYPLFYLTAAVTTLTMAMGSLLYYPFFAIVPGLNLSTPTRILYIFGFSISMLAAIGADGIIRRKIRWQWLGCIASGVLVVAALIAIVVQTKAGVLWFMDGFVPPTPSPELMDVLTQHFSVSSVILYQPMVYICLSIALLISFYRAKDKTVRRLTFGLMLVFLFVDQAGFGFLYNTASPRSMEYPKTPGISKLLEDNGTFRVITMGRFMYNGFVPFGIEDIGGYASFYPERYAKYIHLSQYGTAKPFPQSFSKWVDFQNFQSPLIDLLNVKYMLFPPNIKIDDPQLELVHRLDMAIYKNKAAFPRAFFVTQHEVYPDESSLMNRLASMSSEDLKRCVLLEEKPDESFLKTNLKQQTPKSEIEIVGYGIQSIALNVFCSSSGFLIISNNYHPDWTAYDNGEKARVYRANYTLKAIPLQPGNHTINLNLESPIREMGMDICIYSWTALAFAIGICGIRQLNRYNKGDS